MLHNIANFLCERNAEEPVPVWVENSFPIIKVVLVSLLGLFSLAMIFFVLMQKGSENGSSALTGQSETFYNKNKGTTLQGKIRVLTIIDAVCILVICITFLILHSYYPGVLG